MHALVKKAICSAYRRMGKLVGFESLHYQADAIVLNPLEKTSTPPAIHLQKHLARFNKSNEYSSLEQEFKALFTITTEHAPTKLIHFGKSYLSKEGVLNQKNQLHPRYLINRNQPEIHERYLSSVKHFEKALMVDNDFSNKFFGHWVHDELSALNIKKLPDNTQKIGIHIPDYSHAQGYLDMIQTEVQYGFSGVVDELYLLSDYSQNSYKQARYRAIKKCIAQKLQPKNTQYNGVYIARGNTGANRRLENEGIVIDHLSKRGFDIIHPEKMQAEAIIRRLWNAPMVISVEGSAISHAILSMAHHAGVLVLQPPNRITHDFKRILDAKGHSFGFYVCQQTSEDSFAIDNFDDFDKLIDMVHSASSSLFTHEAYHYGNLLNS